MDSRQIVAILGIVIAFAGMALLLPFLWTVLWGGATPFIGLFLLATSFTIIWRLGHDTRKHR